MALKAGRRGLNKRLVDAFGNFNGEAPSGDYYTKQQTDNKFETKTHVNNTFQKKTLDVPIEMSSGSKLTVEDALQGLNEELTVQAGSAITSNFTVSFSQLSKYGKVVELTAKISGVTGTGFDTVIANIPVGYRCSGNDRRVVCLYSSNSMFPLGLIIKTNGDIQLMQTIDGADVLIHAIWLID